MIKRTLHTFKTSSSKASSTKWHFALYTISIVEEKEATSLRMYSIIDYKAQRI